MKQAAGDGVFDGHESQIGRSVAQGVKHRFEGVAANHIEVGIAEIAASGNVVKRTEDTLNGNVHRSEEDWEMENVRGRATTAGIKKIPLVVSGI